MMITGFNEKGERRAIQTDQKHQQYGWVFYDNHGQWVTLRKATAPELEWAERCGGFPWGHNLASPDSADGNG